MRWPSIGRQTRRSESAADRSGAQAAPASSSAAPESPDSPAHGTAWAALPPMPSSWSARTPLTAPPMTSTERPLTQPVHPARRATPQEGAPEPGRIHGLAAARPARPVPAVEPTAPLPAYFSEQPPLRHAAPKVIVEHAPLTRATDEFVGEPLAPPPPPAPRMPATVIPRSAPMPQPPAEARTDAGARFQEALANLHKSGHPRYEPGVGAVQPPDSPSPGLPSTPAPRPEAPVEARTEAGAKFREALANLHSSGLPRYESPNGTEQPPAADAPGADAPATEDPAGPAAPPRLLHRRSLAESRRIGLGAPMRDVPGPGEPAAEEPQQETTPAPEQAPQPEQAQQPSSLHDALAAAKEAAQIAEAAAAAAQAATPATPVPSATDLPPIVSPAPVASSETPEPPNDGGGGGGGSVSPPLQPRVSGRPIVDPSRRPTASAAPLIFRSAPRPAAPSAPPPEQPTQQAVVTRPPAQLADALRASHGIDIADVQIRRDTEVEREAAQRKARAFTRSATVHLPESAGALDDRRTLGLLAHELVHAAQQRRLGSNLPPEHSPEGRALEAEALDAERTHGGTPASLTSDEPLRHAPPPVTAGWVEDRLTQHALPYNPPTDLPWKETSGEALTIKAWAQIVAEEVRDSGGLGGSGGGSGGPKADTIGGTGATSETQFKNMMLDSVNKERAMQGLPVLTSLTADYDAWASREWDRVDKLKKAKEVQDKATKDAVETETEAKKKLHLAKTEADTEAEKKAETVDKAVKKANELKDISWTPTGGFQKSDGSHAKAQVAAALAAFAASDDGSHEEDVAATTSAGIEITKPAGKGETDPLANVKLSAVEKWEIKRDTNQFKISMGDAKDMQTPADFVAFALARTNRERAERSLPPIAQLPAEFEAQLTQQFTTIYAAAMIAEEKKAIEEDRIAEATEKKKQEHLALAQAKAAEMEKATAVAAVEPTTVAAPTQAGAEPAAAATHTAVLPHELDSTHLEELTQRIYDRLRSRLRTELLVDRERAGLLTDFR